MALLIFVHANIKLHTMYNYVIMYFPYAEDMAYIKLGQLNTFVLSNIVATTGDFEGLNCITCNLQ